MTARKAQANAAKGNVAGKGKGKRRRRRSALEATAYHEAGHAVVGTILNWKVKSINLESGAQGLCVLVRPRGVPAPSVRDIFMMNLAAEATERRYWGRRPGMDRIFGWLGDRESMKEAFAMITPRPASVDESRLRFQDAVKIFYPLAEHYVEGQWPVIKALAAELLTKWKLTGTEANRIMADAISAEKARHRHPPGWFPWQLPGTR